MAVRLQLIEKAVDVYGLMLLHYIQGFTHDRDLADDILQSLWLKVMEHFETEHIMELGMLKRKARQLIIDNIRSSTRRMETVKSVSDLPETDGSYIFRECATPEEEKNLKNAFWSNFRDAKLTEEQKDAFWLKERYGYTIIDISKHLHIPLSTVGDWINKVKHECATHYNRNQYE